MRHNVLAICQPRANAGFDRHPGPAMAGQHRSARTESWRRALEGPDRTTFEFIVIDNGSTDQTQAAVKALCARDPRWKYIQFSRDFGVEASLTAGYKVASGEAIVVLYGDLPGSAAGDSGLPREMARGVRRRLRRPDGPSG